MVEVDRDQRIGVVGEDAFQLVLRCCLEDGVDLVDAGRAGRIEGEIHYRDIDGGHAHRKAIELAIEFGQHQPHRRGGASFGGNHGHRRRTGAAQVFVINVSQHLVVGVGMDRGHQALHHADLLVQRLHQRSEAVGGAGGVGNHRMFCAQHLMIDAIDDGGVDILATGRGNDYLLRTSLEVSRSLLLAGEKASAFQHHIHPQLPPRQFRRIALRQHANFVAIDDHVVAVDRYGAGEFAVRRVVAGEMGVGLGVAKVVDRYDLDFRIALALVKRAQNIAADAAVAIDCDFDGHCLLLTKKRSSCLKARCARHAPRFRQ